MLLRRGGPLTVFLLGAALARLSMHLAGPYFAVYLVENGLSVALVALCFSVNNVSTFAAEYPSGILADRAGRLRAAAMGMLLYGAGILLLLEPSAPTALASAALTGLGTTFTSGSLEAWLADTYSGAPLRRALSLERSLGSATGAVAGLLASALTAAGTRAPFAASAAAAMLSAALLLVPPDNRGSSGSGQILRQSISVLKDPRFLLLAVHYSLVWSAILAFFIAWPLTLVDRGLDKGLLGVVYTALLAAMAAGSAVAQRLLRRLDALGYLAVFSAAALLVYTCVGLTHGLAVTLALFLLLELMLGAYTVSLAYARNLVVPSAVRASAVSLMNLVGSLVAAIAAPLIVRPDAMRTYLTAAVLLAAALVPALMARRLAES
ncbi:MFS transporter [Pyrodictium abyssi]|uniref:Major facilitator superfamily (MFS) profile domain-containing protein n=1 Tax=Pyrodictium abyssi TaxID=54256 RepID=A0ABM8J0F1_9CREN|nr:hypothetical protein PABY_23310 [Pyrodictium abyssi]